MLTDQRAKETNQRKEDLVQSAFYLHPTRAARYMAAAKTTTVPHTRRSSTSLHRVMAVCSHRNLLPEHAKHGFRDQVKWRESVQKGTPKQQPYPQPKYSANHIHVARGDVAPEL